MKRFLAILFATAMFITIGLTVTGCKKETHEHTYSEEWSTNVTHHWRVATCEHTDEIGEKAEHSFGEIIVDEPATPIKKGKGHKFCSVCGLGLYNQVVDYTYDPNSKATLVFDVRGGQPIDDLTVNAGTVVDLTQYTVQRTDGTNSTFEGWIVGGEKVESIAVTGDMVAHATYSCDVYLGKQSVQIGRYPQTLVKDQTIIAELDKLEFGNRNSNGYYEYQGEEYAKQTCVFDSNFGYEQGKAYYFKVEPITWINVGGVWTTLQVIDFSYSYEFHGLDILEYLNTDFYNSLNAEEKAFIADTKLNDANPYKFYLWNVDKFLANHQEQSDRKLGLTDYALCRDDTEFYKTDKFTTNYWLLNPVNNTVDVVDVYNFTGNSYNFNLDWEANKLYTGKAGVRPCFAFDFKGIKKMTGDETVRVTFETNGGEEIATKTLIKEQKYNLPTPERTGFEFKGWYKDAELTQIISANNFTSTKDIKLYAKWEELPPVPDVYTITYELNGGTFNTPSQVKNEYTEGETVNFVNPKKDESVSYTYTFDGWYLESNFVTKVTSTAGLDGNVKVYAKWKETGRYFYINYNIDRYQTLVDAQNPTKVLRAEGTMELPVAKENGKRFIGWCIGTSVGGDTITSISTLRTGSITLTPLFVRCYQVTWNLDGATIEADLPSEIYADAPSIDFTTLIPEKEGYKFLYWSVSWKSGKFGAGLDYETLSFTDGYNLPTTSSTPTITAKFSKEYVLKVNLYGGSVNGSSDDVNIVFGATEGIVTFDNPIKDGATLLGWSRYPECSSEATYSDLSGTHKYFTINDGKTTFSSDKMFGYNSSTGVNDIYQFETIYAIWDKVTVTFNTGVDNLTLDSVVADYNTSFDTTKAEYQLPITNDLKFGGWYLDKEFTRPCGSSVRFYNDCVVYAKWLPKLAITLVYQDGTQDVQYVFEGETLESITITIGQGKYFGGLYFDQAFTSKISNRNNYKPKKDITLYVQLKSL